MNPIRILGKPKVVSFLVSRTQERVLYAPIFFKIQLIEVLYLQNSWLHFDQTVGVTVVMNHGTVIRRPHLYNSHTSGTFSFVVSELQTDVALPIQVYIFHHFIFIVVLSWVNNFISLFYLPLIKMIYNTIRNSCCLPRKCRVVAGRSK